MFLVVELYSQSLCPYNAATVSGTKNNELLQMPCSYNWFVYARAR
jgi:hypothetical protein